MAAKESEEPTLPPLQLGNYRVVRSKDNLLGKGGYGRVYRGKHIETDEDVAVKEVERNDRTNRFIARELAFTKTCNHNNIVQFLSTEQTTDSTYIIMEYCEKGNMNKYMKEKSNFLWGVYKFYDEHYWCCWISSLRQTNMPSGYKAR